MAFSFQQLSFPFCNGGGSEGHFRFPDDKGLLENDYNIRMTENTEETFEDMCDFSRGFYQDGKNVGRAEGIGIGVEREKSNTIKKLLRQEVEKVKRSIAQN